MHAAPRAVCSHCRCMSGGNVRRMRRGDGPDPPAAALSSIPRYGLPVIVRPLAYPLPLHPLPFAVHRSTDGEGSDRFHLTTGLHRGLRPHEKSPTRNSFTGNTLNDSIRSVNLSGHPSPRHLAWLQSLASCRWRRPGPEHDCITAAVRAIRTPFP